jgi:ABC-type microcin C transport system duplicated ATPase subunit YejF
MSEVGGAVAANGVQPTGAPVLQLRDFRVTFPTHFGEVQAVRGVDIDVHEGELLGVVGESGSGKSVTFLGMMQLLAKSARIEGSAKVGGTELVGASTKLINKVRGKRVAMIFQDPLSALNPVHRIGDQIVEMIQSHQNVPTRWRGSARSSCSTGLGSRSRGSGRASSRTSSPVACVSAW